jgi:hypothetical protein
MRRLVKALSGSVLLTIVTLSVPGTALAAQNHGMAPAPAGWNFIEGDVNSNGEWTAEKRGGPRHKTDPSYRDVVLSLDDNVDGGLCVFLRKDEPKDKSPFTQVVCWAAGEYGAKTLATRVLPGSAFKVEAMKRGHGSNNHWGGHIKY